MPNRHVHRPVGAVVGGTTALMLADRQSAVTLALEVMGGALGGCLGAAMPDRIDPPTSPRHRSIGHGVFTAGTGLALTTTQLAKWQRDIRAFAHETAASAVQSTRPRDQAILAVLAALTYLLAGALGGAVAGYASHLTLDAMTPMGLPLLI